LTPKRGANKRISPDAVSPTGRKRSDRRYRSNGWTHSSFSPPDTHPSAYGSIADLRLEAVFVAIVGRLHLILDRQWDSNRRRWCGSLGTPDWPNEGVDLGK